MSQHPKSAKDLFLAALDIEPAERAVFLDDACAGDAALQRQIEALLRVHDEPDSLLDSPRIDLGLSGDAGPNPGTPLDQPVTEAPGTVIGPYKLLQQIGEGGMGVVYMAEQSEPVLRRVALKIIKPGMDTRQVIGRFEAERQALAMMDHPNIAKVLDAGTTESGRPYFVMELVGGTPITQYADEHHLTPRERLELFVPVCQAVQHAHQKGVIHRDIKPSNVLVAEYDGRPVPKIIDFGVAKAIEKRLTEKTMFTEYGQIVGTIDYMSPEQAGLNQVDVDTRSDVYSLGVLLYELLTGETPFDRERLRLAAFDELLRIIREEDPPKPSLRLSTSDSLPSIAANRQVEPKKLGTLVSGELDWIVMKALEKDRTRRYETANGFAMDIQRYLSDEPVEACPPSRAYRFRKFVRRNKMALAMVSVVALALVVGLAGTIWQAVLATKAEGEAKQQRELAEQRLTEVDEHRKRAEANFHLAMQAMDEVYLKSIGEEKLLGVEIGVPPGANQSAGQKPEFSELERKLLRRGLDFYDQFAQQNRENPQALFETGKAFYRVALIQSALDEHDEAQNACTEAISRLKALAEQYPAKSEYFHELGKVCLGQMVLSRWWPDGRDTLGEAERAWTRAIQLDPKDARAYLQRGHVYRYMEQWAGAEDDYLRAVELDPDNASLHSYVGWFFHHAFDQRVKDYSRSLHHAKRAVELDPGNALFHAWLGRRYWDVLGDCRLAFEELDKAIELNPNLVDAYFNRSYIYQSTDLPRALEEIDKALQLDPESEVTLSDRAEILWRLGRVEEALADYEKAERSNPNRFSIYNGRGRLYLSLRQYEAALGDFNKSLELQPSYSSAYTDRALAHFHLGHYEEALADIAMAVELNPNDTSIRKWISPELVAKCPDKAFRDGILELALKAELKAEAVLRDNVREAEKLASKFPDVPEHRKQLAKLYRRLGKSCRERDAFDQSIASYTEAIRLDPELAVAREGRGNTYVEIGEFGKAVTDYEKAVELDPKDASYRNNLAWRLATCLDEANRQPKRAVELAEEAVRLAPGEGMCWNTLGAARYRTGNWKAAIEALEKSRELRSGGDSFDFFFLAVAHWRLGNKDEARTWYDRAFEWMDENKPDDEELARFRDEAAELLGVTEGNQPEEKSESEETQETTDRKSETDGQE